MGEPRIGGLGRGKVRRTTIAGKNARNADDLVKRDFCPPRPDRIWAADFTYVPAWEGWRYTAFVTDVLARGITGRATSAGMNEELVANAFKMAVRTRSQEGYGDLSDLIHHSDEGSQYTADGFFELPAPRSIRASIGSVGDSHDNALAETMFGDCKCTLIHDPLKAPWKSLEQPETETAKRVHWHNNPNITEHNNWKAPLAIEEMTYTTGEDRRKSAQRREA